MTKKPSYKELLDRIDRLEQEAIKHNRAEALWENEERYRTLVEFMGDGMSEIDENGVTTYVNKRLCEMWGYSAEEIVGRPVTDFLDKENRKILKKELAKRRKGRYEPYELVWTRKDRKKIHTHMSPTPFFDSRGKFKGSFAVITDISKRKQEQEALLKSHEQLESRVKERTLELEIKTIHLEEMNTALRVLLKQREEDKIEMEEKMMANVEELVMPYLEKLKNTEQEDKRRTYIDIIHSTLNDILSPFVRGLSSSYLKLTPSEIQIANLVKQGKTTKDIAELLNLSILTVETHRKNIRKKIGIKNERINLRTHLLSLG
jgi:PAS domain S-box-containing protein